MEVTEELRKEWIQKVSTPKREEMWTQSPYSQRVTVNTPLRSAPQEIKEDRDVVEAAAIYGEEYFWNFNKKFRDDEVFVQFLIDNNYKHNIFCYLNHPLNGNAELFRKCVLRGEKVIDYGSLPPAIVENKELILEMLPLNNFYKGLGDHYKLDKEVLSVYMLKHNPHYFDQLSKRMFNHFSKNKPFLLEFLPKCGSAYSKIDNKLKEDLDIIHTLLNDSPGNSYLLPLELLSDKSFMMYAIEKYGISLNNAAEELKNDLDLIKLSIKKNGKDLFLSPTHRVSPELLEISLETHPCLPDVPNTAWNHTDLIIKYLRKTHNPSIDNSNSYFKPRTNLTYFLSTILPGIEKENIDLYREYITNKEIIKMVIEDDLSNLKLFPHWKDDLELANLAFSKKPHLEYLHHTELTNKEFLLNLFENNPDLVQPLHHYTSLYANDYDFLKLIVKKNPTNIQFSAIGKSDKAFIQFMLEETSLNNILLIDSSLWSDKDIAMQFLKKDDENYQYLPIKIKQDDEVIDYLSQSRHPKQIYQKFKSFSGLENNLAFHKKIVLNNYEFYDFIDPLSPIKNDLDLIRIYINSMVDYENKTHLKLITQLPQSALDMYNIKNGSPSFLKANLFRDYLDQQLDNKFEDKSVKKIKI